MTVDTRRISHSNGVTSFRYRSHPFLRCVSSDGAGSASERLFLEVLSPLMLRDGDNGKATLASAMIVLRVEDVYRRLRSALRHVCRAATIPQQRARAALSFNLRGQTHLKISFFTPIGGKSSTLGLVNSSQTTVAYSSVYLKKMQGSAASSTKILDVHLP